MRHLLRPVASRRLAVACVTVAVAVSGGASVAAPVATADGAPAVADRAAHRQAGGKTAAALDFDGERALMYTRDVVAFGPRPAGSDALEQTRRYIEASLAGFGLTVQRDEFVAGTPVGDIPMANLIAEVPAAEGAPEGPAIILSGHYDTLLRENFDFVGANDGGSSTGILIEFGRVLVDNPPPLPVWLVFFDGEEALVQWSDTDGRYGSKHMASRMEEAGELDTIGAMILVDMIGDADLSFPQDANGTDWLNDLVWETAAEIGYGNVFLSGPVQYMEDDHLPFTERGVAAIDLIDFEYGPNIRSGGEHWHQASDTMDKLGAPSFQAIGETVLTVLPRLAERLTGQ